MNKRGQAVLLLFLILIIVVLVFIYPLGGGKNIDAVKTKWEKLSCPELQANMTCGEFGIELYTDSRGCTQAKCKSGPDAPINLAETGTLQIFFVDVGQGDGIYIETPSEKKMVVDSGRGDSMNDFLSKRRVEKIDWMVATHPDSDHIGGMDELLNNYVVMSYITPNTDCSTQLCTALKPLAEKEIGLTFYDGYSGFKFPLMDESVNIEILNPNKDIHFKNDNDMSIVMKVSYGNTSVLLTGDCEKDCEDMMIRLDKNMQADILKVAHHGSDGASSSVFIDKVHPAYAILSYGSTNSYGHPGQELIDRLIARDIKILRTASAGDIELRTDGTKVEWYCSKKTDCFA